MSLLMYKYRLYPSNKQTIRLINHLIVCKDIYNYLLEQSIKTYQNSKKTLLKSDYNRLLKGKYQTIHSQVAQNVSERLYNAFRNFFRNIKNKSYKKGFPRFKSHVNSFTNPQIFNKGKRSGCWFDSIKIIHISKIGNIPIVLHRVPKGKIKTLTIKQNKAGQWFAIFVCELPDVIVNNSSIEKVGIDVGLENFATLSNGEVIANPRYLTKNEKRLKLLQKRLSRKVKGSFNRRKARFKLAKLHNKIVNQRADFLHKLSRSLVLRYSTIIIEKLNITTMVKTHWLAKSINDASWNTFIRNLEYKAVTSGSKLVKVNPRNTSKTCSKCGNIVDMPLSKRDFICPKCGFVCHRDLNASINILKVGTDCAKLNACGDSVSTTEQSVACRIVESGTITSKPSTSSDVGNS